VSIVSPASARVGEDIRFEAQADDADTVVAFHWDFGDGSVGEGRSVQHAYTVAGRSEATLVVERVDSPGERATRAIEASGMIDPRFRPSRNRRLATD
jgi:PKD domain